VKILSAVRVVEKGASASTAAVTVTAVVQDLEQSRGTGASIPILFELVENGTVLISNRFFPGRNAGDSSSRVTLPARTKNGSGSSLELRATRRRGGRRLPEVTVLKVVPTDETPAQAPRYVVGVGCREGRPVIVDGKDEEHVLVRFKGDGRRVTIVLSGHSPNLRYILEHGLQSGLGQIVLQGIYPIALTVRGPKVPVLSISKLSADGKSPGNLVSRSILNLAYLIFGPNYDSYKTSLGEYGEVIAIQLTPRATQFLVDLTKPKSF
jgi:hypothetical protein